MEFDLDDLLNFPKNEIIFISSRGVVDDGGEGSSNPATLIKKSTNMSQRPLERCNSGE